MIQTAQVLLSVLSWRRKDVDMLVHHPAGGTICWFSGLSSYFSCSPEFNFYCADFAGLFFHMPSFSISESRRASFCLCVAFFCVCSLWRITSDVFCTKHVRPGSLKFPSAIAESFSVLCTKCTSLESGIIHRQTSTFNETYMKSWLIAASAFFSWRKWSLLWSGNCTAYKVIVRWAHAFLWWPCLPTTEFHPPPSFDFFSLHMSCDAELSPGTCFHSAYEWSDQVYQCHFWFTCFSWYKPLFVSKYF